jgi:hypothetical protein
MVWSGDLSDENFDHYSDVATSGEPRDVSTNDLGPADGIQNFTYVAMDFGFANAQEIERIRLYFPNSFAFDNVNDGDLEGSNNSTDGSDGDWTTLVALSGLSAPGGYPGWTGYLEFTNTTAYRWIRINGTPPNNNTVLIEWELFSDVDVIVDGIGIADTVDGDTEERYMADGIGLSDSIEAAGGSTFATAPDQVSINDVISANIELTLLPISDGMSINDFIDASIFPGKITDDMTLADIVQGSFEFPVSMTDGIGISDLVDGLNWSQWVRDNADLAIKKYFFTLTGTADSKSDIEIPISAFQARKRTGFDTFLNVTIPGFTHATYVSNRPNGEMVLELGYEIDGTIEIREEILRVDLTKINEFKGARQRSIQLTGYRTHTYSNQISIIENPNYRSTDDGRILYRFGHVDPYVNPGDTCRVGDDEFTIDYITYNISGRFIQMEIRET